jgi:hypothetical protein
LPLLEDKEEGEGVNWAWEALKIIICILLFLFGEDVIALGAFMCIKGALDGAILMLGGVFMYWKVTEVAYQQGKAAAKKRNGGG